MIKRLKRLILNFPTRSHYKFVLKDWIGLFDLKICSEVLETKRFSQNLKPVVKEYPDAKKILVIAPHQDDDIFGAGGTLMKSIHRGADVQVVYLTKVYQSKELENVVRKETEAVCKTVGAKPAFLECEVRNIPLDNDAVNKKLISLINSFKPQVIFIPFLLDDHDDHRRVNHLLMTISEQIIQKKIEIWAFQVYSTILPNVVVDITEYISKKMNVMRVWKSIRGNRDWAHYIKGMNAANCRFLPSKEPLYGEAFFVLPLKEYLKLCNKYFSNPQDKIYYTSEYRLL